MNQARLPSQDDGSATLADEQQVAQFAALMSTFRLVQDQLSSSVPSSATMTRIDDLLAEVTARLEPDLVGQGQQLAGTLHSVPGRGQSLVPPIVMSSPAPDRLLGRVTFSRFYLGYEGAVHGGAIPLVFDEFLGTLAEYARPMSRTAYLHVDYRSITPVDVELRLEGRVDRIEGRKRFVTGAVYDGDRLCAQADALFVELRPRRP